MINNKKNEDLIIDKLMNLTHCIKNIYNQITNPNITTEKKEELYNYISIFEKKENEIYLEIEKKDLLDEQFFLRLEYLINRSNLNNKEEIILRIEKYFMYKSYINPYPSNTENLYEKNIENSYIINCIANIDYILKLYEDIEIALKDDNLDKILLETAKNNLLFSNKIINELRKSPNFPKFDGRNRCIIFKHNEKLVNKIYFDFAIKIIDSVIINILNNNNFLSQLELKSALSLLTSSEIFIIAKNYFDKTLYNKDYQILINNNPNHQVVLDIISSCMEKKPNKK